MVKMTSLDKNKHKFNRKFINKNEDPGQIGNLFCRMLTNGWAVYVRAFCYIWIFLHIQQGIPKWKFQTYDHKDLFFVFFSFLNFAFLYILRIFNSYKFYTFNGL